jgi:hypothetical protein
VVVHELFVTADGFGEFLLLEIGVRQPQLGQARVTAVGVLALDLVE